MDALILPGSSLGAGGLGAQKAGIRSGIGIRTAHRLWKIGGTSMEHQQKGGKKREH
jgi:hypothetical protein